MAFSLPGPAPLPRTTKLVLLEGAPVTRLPGVSGDKMEGVKHTLRSV
jgi:hypothetical protein